MTDKFSEDFNNIVNKDNYLNRYENLDGIESIDPFGRTAFTTFGTRTDFSNYLSSFDQTNEPLPKTWDSFAANYKAFIEDENLDTDAIRDALSVEYLEMTSLGSTFTDTISDSERISQFKAAFAKFLQNYNYKIDGTVGAEDEFAVQWYDFLGYVARIDNGTGERSFVLKYFHNPFPFTYLRYEDLVTNYREVYDAYTATLSNPPDFDELVDDFYFQQVAEKGFFTASRGLSDWTNELEEIFNDAQVRVSSTITLNKEDNYIFKGVSAITQQYLDYASTEPSVASSTLNYFDIYFDNISSNDQFVFELPAGFNYSWTGNESEDGTTVTLTPTGTNDRLYIYPPSSATAKEINAVLRSITYQPIDGTPDPFTATVSRQMFLTYTPSGSITDTDVVADIEFTEQDLAAIASNDVNVTHVHTSVTSDQTKRVLVLTRIFKLLANLIGTLQQVAAAQAQQIQFLTAWQRAFTDVITQVKTFARADGTVFGVTDNSDATNDQTLAGIRADVNQDALNRREQLSAWRGIVSDTAKREQTRLNQSNDAVSQQANMATSIIQQLSTILGAIFR